MSDEATANGNNNGDDRNDQQGWSEHPLITAGVLIPLGPKTRIMAGTHRFKLPGLFMLANGNSVWLESEFDHTNDADAADAEYEKHQAMRAADDFSYPGAYDDPEYPAKYKAFQDLRAAMEKVAKEYNDQIAVLGYSDEEVLKKRELREERDGRVEHLRTNGPPDPGYHAPKAPMHRYANRIVKVDLGERVITYYQADGKRLSMLIADISEASTEARRRLMDRKVKVSGDIANMLAYLYNKTPESATFDAYLTRKYGSDVHKVLKWAQNPESTNETRPWMSWDIQNEAKINTYSDESAESMKLKLVAFFEKVAKDLETGKDYLKVIREMVASGQTPDPQANANQAYWWSEYFPGIPLRAVTRIPHFREAVAKEVQEHEEFARGGDIHAKSRGAGKLALDAFEGNTAAKKVAIVYGHDYQKLVEEENARVQSIQSVKPTDAPMVPHLSKDIKLMPHQGIAVASLDRAGDKCIIDQDMGGGKTSAYFSDAMNQVQKGNARRPMIVMPTNTVAQQVDELLHKFGDGVNIIAITNKSFSKYGKPDTVAYEALKRQILTAPPNTIILCAYEWLQGRPRKFVTGRIKKSGAPDDRSDYWRSRWLIDECGVDMVSLDEAHRVKNPDTARARATYGLNGARIKRIGSGTLFPNTPDDIVGSMAFLDPSVFGSQDSFHAKYGLQAVRGKITSYPPDFLKRVRAELSTVGMVSQRRTNWMHLLPKRVERVHTVELPPQIQTLYELLLAATLDDIKANPELTKAWSAFAEDVGADDIEEGEHPGLLQMLGRLDAFIAAPDTPIGGDIDQLMEDAQGTNEEEAEVAKAWLKKLGPVIIQVRKVVAELPEQAIISPKVRKAAQIIDHHFADPKAGKVIIAGTHVGVAQHFAKFLPKVSSTVKENNIVFFQGGMPAAIERFRDDPEVKVLCAVGWALREGHNLQFANRMILVEQFWAPGDHEQIYARVYRPGSTADNIYIDLIVTEKTLEVAKHGRLLSKYRAMRLVNSEFDDPSQQNISPIRMNEKNIEFYTHLHQLKEHRDQYDAAAAFDEQEAKRLADTMGKDFLDRSGPPLPGAAKIAGFLPYYDPEDIYRPLQVRLIAGKNGRPGQLVITDGESLELFDRRHAKPLDLKYLDDGSGGYFAAREPPDLKEWAAKAQGFGYTVSIVASEAVRPISPLDVDKASSQVPSEEGAASPKQGPRPSGKPATPKPSEWETVAIAVSPSGTTYALYRQPAVRTDGQPTSRHVLVAHQDGSSVGNPAGGENLASFLFSARDPGSLGEVPQALWDKIGERLEKHSKKAGSLPWVKFEAPLPPEVSPEEPAIGEEEPAEVPKTKERARADRIVQSLSLTNYDGVWYVTVSADDDDAEDLRSLGLVWFNSFYQKVFNDMKDTRRILMMLEARGLDVQNQDEFSDHARDAIWKRKIPQRKLLREQLQTMRQHRRKLKSGSISVHYLQMEGQNYIAVSALENQKDIAALKGVPGFNHVSAAYWKPCSDRSAIMAFVRALSDGGYRVLNWATFVASCKEWFHYEPDVDLGAEMAAPVVDAPAPEMEIPSPAAENKPEIPPKSVEAPSPRAEPPPAVPTAPPARVPEVSIPAPAVSPPPAPAPMKPAVPDVVMDKVKAAVEGLKKWQTAIDSTRSIGAITGDPDRYLGEVVRSLHSLFVSSWDVISEFRSRAPGMGVDPEGVLSQLGMPEAPFIPPANLLVAPPEVATPPQVQVPVPAPTGPAPGAAEAAESELSKLVRAATGPGWSVAKNNIDDDFDPEVTFRKGKEAQIVLKETDDGDWEIAYIARAPDGSKKRESFAFDTPKEALAKVTAMMGGTGSSQAPGGPTLPPIPDVPAGSPLADMAERLRKVRDEMSKP